MMKRGYQMKDYKIATKCVRAGYTPGNKEPIVLPIVQSTTYKYTSGENMGKMFDLEDDGYFYTRLANPTNDAVAAKIAALEGGAAAVLTSSGQAANLFAVLNLCAAGDHVVSSVAIYGGTFNLFNVTLRRMGIDFTFQSLRALPDNYNGWCLRMIGFSPDVVETRKALEYVDVFMKYLEERPAWLSRGELGAFGKYCKTLLEKRDQLVQFLSSYKGDPRAQLIAGFYHGWFSRQFELKARKELSERFRTIQRKVSELCERYSEASDPVEQIAIRAKILSLGIPGDAQLHSKWVQKFEGGGR